MDPNLHELIAHGAHEGDVEDKVEAIIRLLSPGEIPKDVEIVARFGDIATCRLPRSRIVDTWADQGVASLKAAQPFGASDGDEDEVPHQAEHDPEVGDEEVAAEGRWPEHWSEGDYRRPDGLDTTGAGTIVSVIDWGFDFAHDNFRNEDGSTRIIALWDQTNERVPSPSPYGYGRVFTHEEINQALQSEHPYEALGYHPGKSDPRNRGTHGTHVLDIAAGNGRLPGSVQGVAPEADLVLVHAASTSSKEPANLGDSVSLLEALDWIRSQAGACPWVVNMSVGRHGGPHNGLTLVEQCIDRLLEEAPGRCVVQSAGNYYHANVHAGGQMRPGDTRVLRWRTEPADRTANELEIWYAKSDALDVSLTPPDGEGTITVPLGGQAPIKRGGQVVGRFYHRARDPSNGDHHVNIFLYPEAPAGEWQVTLFGDDVVDGRYNCWVERDSSCLHCQSRLAPDDVSVRITTGTICNGHRNIAVGAYDAHDPSRKLGRFSSSGPTVDGRVKPDLIAPGVRVWAAKSTPLDSPEPVPALAMNSGTSMAAPHVAGAVANLFQAAGRPLTITETRRLLLSTARPASFEDTATRHRIGSGFLDLAAAVEAAAEWTRRRPAMAEMGEVPEATEIPAEIDDTDRIDEADEMDALVKEIADNYTSLPLDESETAANSTEESIEVNEELDPLSGVEFSNEEIEIRAVAAEEMELVSEVHECECKRAARLQAEGSPMIAESFPEATIALAEEPDAVAYAAAEFNDWPIPASVWRAESAEPDPLIPEASTEFAFAGPVRTDRMSEVLMNRYADSVRETAVLEALADAAEMTDEAAVAQIGFSRAGLSAGRAFPETVVPASLLAPPPVRGSRDHVLWVQRALNQLFGWGLIEDGIAGPQTRGAVRRFQSQAGLVADGVVGPLTESALLQALEEGQSTGGSGSTCAGIGFPEILNRFVHGEANVLPAHQTQLIRVAKCIVDRHGTSDAISAVRIVGHTDVTGEDASNLELGLRRANAVKAALKDRLRDRAPHLRLHTEAVLPMPVETRGEQEPRFPTDAENRRVELFLPELKPPDKPKPKPKPKPEDRLPKVVARCFKVLAAEQFPDEQRKRLTCLMSAALNPAVDNDLYINGKDFNVRQLAQGIHPRMSPKDFVTFVASERVRRDLRGKLFAPDDQSDSWVKASMEALDERILAGINLIADQTRRNSELNVNNPILRQMQEFVAAAQRSPKSIYFCYGFGQK